MNKLRSFTPMDIQRYLNKIASERELSSCNSHILTYMQRWINGTLCPNLGIERTLASCVPVAMVNFINNLDYNYEAMADEFQWGQIKGIGKAKEKQLIAAGVLSLRDAYLIGETDIAEIVGEKTSKIISDHIYSMELA